MATLSLTLFKAKALQDGRHKIRVAVRHKRQTAYIITSVVVDSEAQFRNGQVVGRPDAPELNARLRRLLDRYQRRLDDIPDPGLYTCPQLRAVIAAATAGPGEHTFGEACDGYIEKLHHEKRDGHAKMLDHNRRAFEQFTRGPFPLSGITPELILAYADHLREKGLSRATVGTMLARTKLVINYAVRSRMVRYDLHPFASCRIPAAPVREADLPLDELNRIRRFATGRKRLAVARDLFCLSFYLGGANLADIMAMDFRGDTVEYVRAKTRNTSGGRVIRLALHPAAREIARRWMGRAGRLDFGYRLAYQGFSRYVARSLGLIAAELGIRGRVMFYSARKSFAQYAADLGIPDPVIDYCLGHSPASRGVIRYYARVRQQQADIAVARVIDYADHPGRYEDAVNLRRDILMRLG